MSADGRRWRDYEQAAEAPAPSLEDRLEPRVTTPPNGTANGTANGAVNGAVNGRANGVASGGAMKPGGGDDADKARQIWKATDLEKAGDPGKTENSEKAEDSRTAGDGGNVGAEKDGEIGKAGGQNFEKAQNVGDAEDAEKTGMTGEAGKAWVAALGADDVEGDWLDRACRPPRLEETRPYGKPGGLAKPDLGAQESLAQAVNGRFPDPRGTWIRLINAEGPTEDPFRSTNAVDCALAVISTWHGEPVVAVRRQPEYDASGKPLLTGETGGVARAEEWLGHRFDYVGHGRRAYVAIAQRLDFGGHGAAAMLITRWPGGGSHAWNAVNCRGEVLWIDAQRGHMAVEPPYEDVTGVFSVVIDREGQRL